MSKSMSERAPPDWPNGATAPCSTQQSQPVARSAPGPCLVRSSCHGAMPVKHRTSCACCALGIPRVLFTDPRPTGVVAPTWPRAPRSLSPVARRRTFRSTWLPDDPSSLRKNSPRSSRAERRGSWGLARCVVGPYGHITFHRKRPAPPRDHEADPGRVDPAGLQPTTKSMIHHGIVCAGQSGNEGFVLEDASCRGSPMKWARSCLGRSRLTAGGS